MGKPARWWIGTLPEQSWDGKEFPSWITYARGQLEQGESTGFRHWQLVVHTSGSSRLSKLKSWVNGHWEPTKSVHALEYVWKEQTRIGEPFEFGNKPIQRSSKTDWTLVRKLAVGGELAHVPDDIFVRHYMSLTRIARDNLKPVALERQCFVYWGRTGTGKSRKAWDEGGMDAYPKDPLTKWWDAYSGESNVIIDEFRGTVSISHLLRWLDRYPVLVETKGGSAVLRAERIWITSNLDPRLWYPELDPGTLSALMRRLNITHFN